MVLKPAVQFSLLETRYNVVDVSPKLEFGNDDNVQKTDKKTGLPLWSVVALRRQDDRTEQVSISVPSAEKPPLGVCEFENLRIHFLAGRGPGDWTGIYLTADSVHQGGAR